MALGSFTQEELLSKIIRIRKETLLDVYESDNEVSLMLSLLYGVSTAGWVWPRVEEEEIRAGVSVIQFQILSLMVPGGDDVPTLCSHKMGWCLRAPCCICNLLCYWSNCSCLEF